MLKASKKFLRDVLAYPLRMQITRMKVLYDWSSGLYYKTFRIIIYDCNDGTIVQPVL